jgi:hypothetical protein
MSATNSKPAGSDGAAAAVLTPEQREQFETRGFVLIRGAFDGDAARARVAEACRRAGYDLDAPSTWKKPYVRLEAQPEPVASFSPAAWEVACALVGGADRIAGTPRIDVLALNLRQGADEPFRPASPDSPGWHKDGWHFRHFLDSPEQGLLGIPLLTDVLPRGGATFLAAGSVALVARFLAAHPEGVLPDDFPWRDLLLEGGDSIEYIEATGEAGDFYLCHPFLLHAVSQNVLRRPRAISNVLYELKAPLKLDRRADGAAPYSPVERAVLRGLGAADRYPFAPTGARFKTPDNGPINRAYA